MCSLILNYISGVVIQQVWSWPRNVNDTHTRLYSQSKEMLNYSCHMYIGIIVRARRRTVKRTNRKQTSARDINKKNRHPGPRGRTTKGHDPARPCQKRVAWNRPFPRTTNRQTGLSLQEEGRIRESHTDMLHCGAGVTYRDTWFIYMIGAWRQGGGARNKSWCH